MEKTDKKYKYFSAVVKAEKDDRIIEAIGSTSKVDRDKEIVNVKGMDISAYKQNPVLLWSHQHDMPPIGRAEKITKTKDGELKFELKFAEEDINPFADVIYKLYKNKYLNSFSIGFMPDFKEVTYDEKKGITTYNKAELLELSAVPVPANSGAVVITRSLINKAVDDKVIDKAEATDFEMTLKEYGFDLSDEIEDENKNEIIEEDVKIDKESEPEEIKDEITVLKEKINSLEQRIKQLESEDKEMETDSYLEKLLQYSSDDESIEEDTDEGTLKSLLVKYDIIGVQNNERQR